MVWQIHSRVSWLDVDEEVFIRINKMADNTTNDLSFCKGVVSALLTTKVVNVDHKFGA